MSDMQAKGLATRRPVLGDAPVNRAKAAIAAFLGGQYV